MLVSFHICHKYYPTYSQYKALVETLLRLFGVQTFIPVSLTSEESNGEVKEGIGQKCSDIEESGRKNGAGAHEFIMSWNRRIDDSKIFFQLMQEAGFRCIHHGKCVYSFYRNAEFIPDSYIHTSSAHPTTSVMGSDREK